MNQRNFCLLEEYMLSCIGDVCHDEGHIRRVLYNALEIAKTEGPVDYDVLIAACLLHDIARKEQMENPALCHAVEGGEKAYRFLTEHGFAPEFAQRVKECIQTHSYREGNPPRSIEAKILFDADKLDAAGAIGIARTLMYKSGLGEPLYTLLPDGTVSDGEKDAAPSFLHEYKRKLAKLYDNFYTAAAAKIARQYRQTAQCFYEGLFQEVSTPYQYGKNELERLLADNA